MPEANLSAPILPGSRTAPSSALVINIFGGPSSGKTVLASDIFTALKKYHIEAACPEEHAKLALRHGQGWILDHQSILLGRTWETLQALQDKVSVIVVDSPLLLCSVYAGEREPTAFHQLVADMHRRTTRMNILLSRDPSLPYSMNGRRENRDQALAVDTRIIDCLDRHNEGFVPFSRASGALEALVGRIRAHFGDEVLAS